VKTTDDVRVVRVVVLCARALQSFGFHAGRDTRVCCYEIQKIKNKTRASNQRTPRVLSYLSKYDTGVVVTRVETERRNEKHAMSPAIVLRW